LAGIVKGVNIGSEIMMKKELIKVDCDNLDELF
jgi:hypothetical protein